MSIVVRARMSAARARRFAALVEALADEFADGAPGEGETFGFVGAIYVPDWARREEPTDVARAADDRANPSPAEMAADARRGDRAVAPAATS